MFHVFSRGSMSATRGLRHGDVPRSRMAVVSRTAMLVALAFLLGRTLIGHTVAPFGVAYFATLTELAGSVSSWPALFAIAGSASRGDMTGTIAVAGAFFLYRLCRKLLFGRKTPDPLWAASLAGLVDAATRLATTWDLWTRYDVMIAVAEGTLVVILSMIFIQAIPFLMGNSSHRTLRNEHWISLTILTGSVIAGLTGISVDGVGLGVIGIDAIVLAAAFVGGVGAATSSAIVLGVLAVMGHTLTLGDVAALAFAGLLAGVLREAGRVAASAAFIVGLIALDASMSLDIAHLQTASIQVFLAGLGLFAVPNRVFRMWASFVPGTSEQRLSEQRRSRRMQVLLGERIHDISAVFDQLAATFEETQESSWKSARALIDSAVDATAQVVCHACARKHKCWAQETVSTYNAMVNTAAKMDAARGHNAPPTRELRDRCIRIDSMMGVLRYNLELMDRDAKWMEKLQEQRELMAAQLAGIAHVIQSVARHVEHDQAAAMAGEEQILASMEQLGLYVDHVHIVSLAPGKVEVEVTQPSHGAYENSVRMIAPLLSGIVGENIIVRDVIDEASSPCKSVFASAPLFRVNTAVATAARDGKTVSGDTFTSMDIGNGRFAVAVSDGMGNGERARKESNAAIELLKKLLKAGFDEQLAIQTVNSTLLLRSSDEMFTTLDMALVDLFSANAEFLKIGSVPSFIKRKDTVYTISGSSVPIGILRDIEVQTIHDQLRDGDILVLVSDGVLDAPQGVEDKEEWLRNQIQRLQTSDPQALADTLLEAAVRANYGQIEDDMTVMAAVISRCQPEWTSIQVPGTVRLRQDDKRRGA